MRTPPPIRLALLALLALPLSLPPAAAQEGEEAPWETRVHDISDLRPETWAPMRRSVGDGALFRVWPSRYQPSEAGDQLFEQGAAGRFSPGEIASLLSSLVNEVDENGDVGEDDGRLRVKATAEGQERAAAALEVLRRANGRPIVIEVEEFLLPPEIDAAGGADDATFAAWRERDLRGASRLLGLSLEPGCWRLAEDVEGVRGVVDVDVEIAQDAAIADPVVARIDTGLRVIAQALPLTAGRETVLLRVLAGAAHLRGAPRRVAFGEDELGAADLADMDGLFASTELLLAPGAPQTIVAARPEGGARVLVFRLVAGPAMESGGSLRVLPHGALSSSPPAIRLTVSDYPEIEGRAAFALAEWDDGAGRRRLDMDSVLESLEREISVEMDEGTAEVLSFEWMLGGAYAMRARSEALERVAARLRELEEALVRHARLTVRIEARAPGAGTGPVVGVLAAPVPLAMPVALAAYRNTAFVADQEVEVAEKSRISDPVIGSALAGIVANATVSRSGPRSHEVALEMRVMHFEGPDLLPFTASDVGSVERIVDRSLYTESRVRVPSGNAGEVLLGSSPFGPEPGSRLVAVITVE